MIERILYLDTETKNWVHRDEGDRSPWAEQEIFDLGLACCAGLTRTRKEQATFIHCPDEVPQSLVPSTQRADTALMQRIINAADLIVTFNGNRFDNTVLRSAGFEVSSIVARSHDILEQFHKVAGHRISLKNLAASLDISSKEIDGEEIDGKKAAQMWKEADALCADAHPIGVPHAAVEKYRTVQRYCLQDVQVTAAIFDHLWSNDGKLCYRDWNGTPKEVQLAIPEGLPHRSEFPIPF